MRQFGISCKEANSRSIVAYLATLGHHPLFMRGGDHWYLSPLREEKTASFKVSEKLNVWYDHGAGIGGTLVDFGIRFFRCTVKEFLHKLALDTSFQQQVIPSFQQPATPHIGPEIAREAAPSPIRIIAVKPIESPPLLDYLSQRKIPTELARRYCCQIDFELYQKKISTLGLPNCSGGYELRGTNFKGCSRPKDVSFIDNGTDRLAVFEGLFSFLSFLSLAKPTVPLTNFLVLNSLAMLERARPLMDRHAQVLLYLDNDPAGQWATTKALGWGTQYQDSSHFYAPYKDPNDFLRDQAQYGYPTNGPPNFPPNRNSDA
ncbi:MAG TPA: toprim domain-containing protein [Puia sp.]|uniref:toprim domain-containing protein n=1 Tax=Puia sp. TaxID=2045100 RepID=UPI002C00D6CF|nr:toprim domain-containing protein [Puia sp.]HVU97326.1 toprim domain-containing protein [Puia sp.]